MPLGSSAGASYCRTVARRSGSNFYYALWLLPPARREAMFAVYSFCRAVDDVVDSGWPTELAYAELERWRQELAACYEGRPVHPIAQALVFAVRRYDLPKAYLDDLLVGMSWDLSPRRYATWDELERYCYHVAGVVGLMAVRVFGCRGPQRDDFAKALATAFQLTNILRDVGGDADQGRIYLPQEDMARFGVEASDIQAHRETPALTKLLAFEGARAREYFRRAYTVVMAQDRMALTPALAMAAVYERILGELERGGYAVFSRPVRLPTGRKLAVALGGALGWGGR